MKKSSKWCVIALILYTISWSGIVAHLSIWMFLPTMVLFGISMLAMGYAGIYYGIESNNQKVSKQS